MRELYLRNLWKWKCGFREDETKINYVKTIKEIKRIQLSKTFISLMENRMVQGYFRYGDVKKSKGKFNNVSSIIHRAKMYKKSGNDEILVDIANIAMCEFINGIHPNKHFKSEDDGYHTPGL